MVDKCKETCSEHSGLCANITFLYKEVENLKEDLSFQKGFWQSKLEESGKEMKDLRRELTDKMEAGFSKLESIISKNKEDLEKENSNKKWVIISTIASPLFVGIVLLIAQHYIK